MPKATQKKTCCVCGVWSTSKERRFHRFPSNEIICKKWIDWCIGKGDVRYDDNFKQTYVCESHFDRSCYSSSTSILRSCSVPSIYTGCPSKLAKKESVERYSRAMKRAKDAENLPVLNESSEVIKYDAGQFCDVEIHEAAIKSEPMDNEVQSEESYKYITTAIKFENNFSENIQYFHCLLCDFTTNINDNFHNHIKAHREKRGEDAKFEIVSKHKCQCIDCKYRTRNIVFDKTDTKHYEKDIFYECTKCKNKSTNLNSVSQHLSICDNTKFVVCEQQYSGLFQCLTCNYNTQFECDIQKHIKLHERLYQCSVENCPYNTNLITSFERHVISHDILDTIVWFQCSFCYHKTDIKYDMAQHIKDHDKDNEDAVFNLSVGGSFQYYQCTDCKFKSRDEYIFNKHLSSHKPEKESNTLKHDKQTSIPLVAHQCTYCFYVTTKLENFYQHLVQHQYNDNTILFKCEFCDHKSNNPLDVREHIKSHSEKESR